MYRTIRLRTKFLLSLLAVTAGLTAATLYVVSYGFEMRVWESFRGELHSSVKTYETFARERESSLVRSAQMLANLPKVRALMTTEDAATIQDESASIWRMSGDEPRAGGHLRNYQTERRVHLRRECPRKGTTFEIYLPHSTKAVLLPGEIQKGKPLAGRNETILVVEDEPGVPKLASEFLKAGGYNILEASEGPEALRIVNSHSGTIDIVLTDMVMPGKSGSELAETLKRIRPGTRVIYMSGYAEFSGKNGERPPGETRVLQKPFSRNTLLEKVREAMRTAPFSPQDATKVGEPA